MTDAKLDDRQTQPVLTLENLAVSCKVRGGKVDAVLDVSFDIEKGQSYGIVGESGCGKTDERGVDCP